MARCDETWRAEAAAAVPERRETDWSAASVSLSLRGLRGALLLAGETWTPPKSYPPQPQLVPLNEVLPNTGMPHITSDPPPWDATAVDRNPP